jgi:hypothetical protein
VLVNVAGKGHEEEFEDTKEVKSPLRKFYGRHHDMVDRYVCHK